MKVKMDEHRRCVLEARRAKSAVIFIQCSSEDGVEVADLPPRVFDRFYRAGRTRRRAESVATEFAAWSRVVGATHEALDLLATHTVITEEDREMAAAKTGTRKHKRAKAEAKKTKKQQAFEDGRRTPEAARCQELLKAGKHSDEEIFEIMHREFGWSPKQYQLIAYNRLRLNRLANK